MQKKSLKVTMGDVLVIQRASQVCDELVSLGGSDYAGTRPHADVRAFKQELRNQIVAVHNQVIDIGKGVHLNVVAST